MEKKRPTQSDVARAAGVSRATVSYVLNDHVDKRIPISLETRQRVLDVVADLNYRIDARAQALRSGDTKSIGVLLPMYENPFFWQILVGIAKEAEVCGYNLLLAHNTLTPEAELESIRELAEQRVDGLIILTNFKQFSDQASEQLRTSRQPVVEITDTPSEFDYVQQGYGDGARAVMEHLLELGHRRIGFIYGVQSTSQGIDRREAHRQALIGAGLPYDEGLVFQCGPYMEDGYEAVKNMLSLPDRPTAIIVINDLLAVAAIRAATDVGVRVPQDLSIAGFDDIPFSSYTVPRLTSVSGEPEQNGRDAVRMLINRLNDPAEKQQIIVSGWTLTVRESTGPAPGSNTNAE
ncbi:MAG: LacI family DNA-binding transcriptional regulator [Chloroflexi bacterium]|nr:LacI family DNA-binding transcriptional regulator [Chloroflexota bacterium]